MAPLNRDHVVYGPFTLKGGKLKFQCGGGTLAYDARKAMDAGSEFAVHVMPPEGSKEVKGKVLSVDLVKGATPVRYEIVMRDSS
jgi:hypothetical protein